MKFRTRSFQNYGDYHQSRNLAMALHNLHQGNSQPRAYVLKWDTQLARIRRDERPKDFMVVNYFIEGFNSSRLREQLRLRQHQNYTSARKHVIDPLTDNSALYGGKGQVRSRRQQERPTSGGQTSKGRSAQGSSP
jgi:hypothetical protein